MNEVECNSSSDGPTRNDCRRYGPCHPVRGIVIQERADETTLLAVAFDARVTGPRGVTELSVVVEAVSFDGFSRPEP